jgi:ABC-type dipeptide/oligopeptide/nickel transport system ATPase component
MEANVPEVFVKPRTGDCYPMAVVGQIGSGKTVLVCYLIRTIWRWQYDVIVWISPTYHLQDFSQLLPNSKGIVVFDRFSLEILEILKEHQMVRNDKRKERMLLILDDNGQALRQNMKGQEMDEILTTCRHRKITIVQLAQRYTQLSPTLRCNARFMILFAECNPLERQNLYHYQGFGNRKWYLQTVDEKTKEKYSWIGIESFAGSSKFFNKDGYL